jgi:hypothetical protein
MQVVMDIGEIEASLRRRRQRVFPADAAKLASGLAEHTI